MTTAPVSDWKTDFDVLDPGYVIDPYAVWNELRTECPVARSERWGGAWMPVRYNDITAVAHDVEHFSSREVGVINTGTEDPLPGVHLPPIDMDPPDHGWARRLILPWFSHTRVESYEPLTRDLCKRLVAAVIETGQADLAGDYAQQIPVRVISWILGVPEELAPTFTGWVRDVLEFGHEPERSTPAWQAIAMYFFNAIEERKVAPGDDLISDLLHATVEGQPVPDAHVLGSIALALVAGVDTTWSAIGSAMWHLATHPADCERLIAEPDLMPTAIEELLRAYSPVTMARVVESDTEVAGCPMKAGDRVLMNFPAANRDPEIFDRADEVVLDRQVNRHVAFGSGIHRCAGSNLARMELRVAIETWLASIPVFHLADGATVTWAGGQVRGPRSVPVTFG